MRVPGARRAAAATATVAVGAGLVLAGCGGSDGDPDAQAAAKAQASAIQSAVDSAPTTAATAAAPAAGAVSGEEFCTTLRKENPRLESMSQIGAYAQLTIAIADLYDKKGALETLDASTLDALAGSCPEDAAKALKAAGKKSFAELR